MLLQRCLQLSVSVCREKFVVQPSHSACENLLFGRMSFKGFNPEVEVCAVFITALFFNYFMQWAAIDVKIKVPSAENPGLSL